MRSLNKGENIKSLAEKEKLPLRILQLDVVDDESVKKARKRESSRLALQI